MSVEKSKILIVDDEQEILNLLQELLSNKGFHVITANSGDAALKCLNREKFNIVVTDLIMPGGIDGIELLDKIKKASSETEVIVITGYGSIGSAVEATKRGAYDYITKPIDHDYLLLIIKRIFDYKNLKAENLDLHTKLENRSRFENLIGKSHQMQKIFQLIEDIAATNSTVLIRGENGTGKELIANAIYKHSHKRRNKIVRVNCAVLSDNLLESELFGHVKGAFTGAIKDRIGRFELADNGTLFLDEIGEITPRLQVKLLRAIQEGEFERVGGSETIKVNVRIIAATNKDLEKAIKDGEFRKDLYYRLNVIPIDIPPLRDRVEDIPLLVNNFIAKYNNENNKNIKGITPEALEILMKFDWPGNVRELENVIERAVVLTKDEMINEDRLSHLNIKNNHKTPMQMLDKKSLPLVMDEIEKELIKKTLVQYQGNKSRAAKKLGIHRSTFLSKITKYGIST